MYLKKNGNKKIEILISYSDLEKKDLSITTFMSSNIKRRMIIMDYCKKIVGSSFKYDKIIIDYFFESSLNVFIVIVNLKPFTIKKHNIHKHFEIATFLLAKFQSFETLCSFCNTINIKTNSSLLLFNNNYYLRVKIYRIIDYRNLIFLLKEFIITYQLNKNISENAKLLISKNAIETCKDL